MISIDDFYPEQPKPKRPTIAELEALLDREEDVPIEILPNGEIAVRKDHGIQKVLTMRENLGGEYERI